MNGGGVVMWKIEDIVENIILGSKFEHGMTLCTKTEFDNKIITIYVNVNGKTVIVDTEPSLSTTDDTYNILYNKLKNSLRGFKINIKTKRTKQRKENDDIDDIDTIYNDNEITTLTDTRVTNKVNKVKTKTKNRSHSRRKKRKSRSKSE
jgi:hypothetical protein